MRPDEFVHEDPDDFPTEESPEVKRYVVEEDKTIKKVDAGEEQRRRRREEEEVAPRSITSLGGAGAPIVEDVEMNHGDDDDMPF